MVRIGLTGGIGAGKSTVAQMFRERGVPVIDADAVAREVVEPGEPALARIAERFGSEVLAADGSLDRQVLAARAFTTPESTQALNAIMHPAIGRRSAELFARYADATMVVHDVPLLVENGLAPNYHLAILVDVPARERVRRLVESRGLDADDAWARIARQASDEERLAACDIVLDNSGAPEDLAEEFAELFSARLAPFADNLRLGIAVPAPTVTVPADAGWPAEAARTLARITRACDAAGLEVARLSHVGPTAVPGGPAANVLDFELVVPRTEREGAVSPMATTNSRVGPVASAAGFVSCDPALFADWDADTRADAPAPRGETFASADPGRPARLLVTSDT